MTQCDLIKRILHLSFFTIYFDGMVGILTFIDSTSTIASALTGVWILKLILATHFSLVAKRGFPVSLLYQLIILFSCINLIRGVIEFRSVPAIISSGFFYISIFVGGASGLAWYYYIQGGGKIIFQKIYVIVHCFIFTSVCLLYFLLFISGVISYFGMGVQSYLISGLLLSSNQRVWLPSLVIIGTVMTGKRSLLIVLIIQNWQNLVSLKKKYGVIFAFFGLSTIAIAGVLLYNLDLFVRFNVFSDLTINDLVNYDDPDSNHRLYIATSGRSNEIIAFLTVINPYDLDFWLGYSSDFNLTVENSSTMDSFKQSYLHFSPLNYLKHFGIILGSWLFLTQVKVAIFAMRHGVQRKDLGLNLYLGYFCSMFFGAIVLIDVLYWVSFFYSYFQWVNRNTSSNMNYASVHSNELHSSKS